MSDQETGARGKKKKKKSSAKIYNCHVQRSTVLYSTDTYSADRYLGIMPWLSPRIKTPLRLQLHTTQHHTTPHHIPLSGGTSGKSLSLNHGPCIGVVTVYSELRSANLPLIQRQIGTYLLTY